MSDWLVNEIDKEILKLQCPPNLQEVKEEDIVVWVDPLDGTSEYTQGIQFKMCYGCTFVKESRKESPLLFDFMI